MRKFAIISILASVFLAFQNCGETVPQANNFGQVTQSAESDCRGVDCFAAEELLWLRIREYDPYRISLRNLPSFQFNIGGQCGVGTFEQHTFAYEMIEAFGQQRVVGRGFVDNRCDLGQFSVPITPNIDSNILENQRYTVTLELVGISNDGEQFTNPSPTNQGRLDVIFVNDTAP